MWVKGQSKSGWGKNEKKGQTLSNSRREQQPHFNKSATVEDKQVYEAIEKYGRDRKTIERALQMAQLRDSRKKYNAGLVKGRCTSKERGFHELTEEEEEKYIHLGPTVFPRGHLLKSRSIGKVFRRSQRQRPIVEEQCKG